MINKDFFSLLTFIQESIWPEPEDDNNMTHPQDLETQTSTILDAINGSGNHNNLEDNSFMNNQAGFTSISSLNYELVPPHPSSSSKRTYHEHAVNTSSSSTMKKARLHAQSSIRKAVEEGKPGGLLLYFKKATEAEHQAYLDRTTAEAKENAENKQWNKGQRERILQVKKRVQARERKRKQRAREMKVEVACGLHSPGGTKSKVSITACYGKKEAYNEYT
jgi:hypothetical protein